MICPSCGADRAYQGFDYRDNQVDCVNKRCVQYSEKHAKAELGVDDTEPDCKEDPTAGKKYTGLRSGAAISLLDQYSRQGFLDEEDLEVVWDSVFGSACRILCIDGNGSHVVPPGDIVVVRSNNACMYVDVPPGYMLWKQTIPVALMAPVAVLFLTKYCLQWGTCFGYHNNTGKPQIITW